MNPNNDDDLFFFSNNNSGIKSTETMDTSHSHDSHEDDTHNNIHQNKSLEEVDMTETEEEYYDEEEAAASPQDGSVLPVLGGAVGSSLPAPDEIRTDVSGGKQISSSVLFCKSPAFSSDAASCGVCFNKRYCKIFLALAVLTTVFVGIGLGVSRNQKDMSSTMSSDDPQERLNHIVSYLTDHKISHPDALKSLDTPQNKAVHWLANNTEWDLPHTDVSPNQDDFAYRFIVRYVMAVNYYTWNHENQWGNKLNFLTPDMDVCDWDGVVLHETQIIKKAGISCDPNKRPILFNLYSNNMKGTIPTENGLLTSLLSFNVEFNQLEGSIPTELCHLSNLQVLALGNNKFNKNIPQCIGGKMHLLKQLLLDHNDFTGELPTSLGNLGNLERLFLTDNLIRGDPSAVFNRLRNMKILLADQNMFQAHIDRSFLPKHNALEWLDLGSNELQMMNNSLPTHLFKLPALQVLDISLNRFEGTFPTSIPENKVLRYFSAYGNQFKGDVPSALKNLKKLEHLDLSINHFHGDLHSEIGHMTHLRFLYLGDNPKLRHAPIPTWLANLTNLHDLSLHDTNRTGEIPSFIGNLTKLEFLDLSSNKNLTYNMSASNWGHLKNLEFLVLNENPNINGTIPSSFSTLHKLRAVFLDATSISGNVELLCALPAFDNPSGDEAIFADCAGAKPLFNCTCCTCCYSKGCSGPYLDKWKESWELDSRKLNFQFDNLTRFYDMVELPNKNSGGKGSTNHSML